MDDVFAQADEAMSEAAESEATGEEPQIPTPHRRNPATMAEQNAVAQMVTNHRRNLSPPLT